MPNKLQKRPPPPSLASSTTFEAGCLYENLPHNTKPPISLGPAEGQVVLSGALMSNNPYNYSARSGPISAPAGTLFSPVSPLEPATGAMSSQMQVPEPEQPTSSRGSVEIRRLDGTPYTAGQKQVKVAQDMHQGAMPPAYKRQSTDPTSHSSEGAHGCSKANCNKCGKRKTMQAEQSSPSSSRVIPHYSRPISQSSTLAGPSSASVGQPLKTCTKCGKFKKPAMAPMPPQPVFGAQARHSTHPSAHFTRAQQAGLSIQPSTNMPQGMQPQIDIIPPSASTYRPINSALSNYNDDRPFLPRSPKQEPKHFRASSLIRSLSRRSSKKEGPRTPDAETGEQSSGGFMGVFRNQSTKDYQKLRPEEGNSRPASPAFSFMETPNEDYFEMKPMNKETQVGSPGSDGTRSPSIKSPTGMGETLSLGQPSSHHRSNSIQRDDLMLSIPEQGGDNKPQLTRFKSLRSGVSRAASTVSRSSSLKRLGSLHQAFYRDDMSLDAHNDGDRGTVAAF